MRMKENVSWSDSKGHIWFCFDSTNQLWYWLHQIRKQLWNQHTLIPAVLSNNKHSKVHYVLLLFSQNQFKLTAFLYPFEKSDCGEFVRFTFGLRHEQSWSTSFVHHTLKFARNVNFIVMDVCVCVWVRFIHVSSCCWSGSTEGRSADCVFKYTVIFSSRLAASVSHFYRDNFGFCSAELEVAVPIPRISVVLVLRWSIKLTKISSILHFILLLFPQTGKFRGYLYFLPSSQKSTIFLLLIQCSQTHPL